MDRFGPKGRHSSVMDMQRGPDACVGLTVNWKSFFEAKERGLG